MLADYYLTQPRHEISRDSELLQAQLLQPLSLSPVQSRLAGDRTGFFIDPTLVTIGASEYSSLFVTPGLRANLDLAGGDLGTWGDSAIISGLTGRLSFSVNQYHFETNGFRQNNDFTQDIYGAFGQLALSPDTSALVELRHLRQRRGDTSIYFFDSDNFDPILRDNVDADSVRIGFKHTFTPGSTLIATYAHQNLTNDTDFGGFFIGTEQRVDVTEARYILDGARFSVTIGGGAMSGSEENQTIPVSPAAPEDTSLRHNSAYIYGYFQPSPKIAAEVGVSIEDYRDAFIERNVTNPKFGLVLTPTPKTKLRFAAFKTLKRLLLSSQTIEPTSVAGFSQFYDDINGTTAKRWAAAIDHTVTARLFAGAEYSRRELKIPSVFPVPMDVPFDEELVRGYLYYVLSRRLSLAAELQYEHFEGTSDGFNPSLIADAHTYRLPIELRYAGPQGLFAKLRVTPLWQSGDFFNATAFAVAPGDAEFVVTDVTLGYTLPRRLGTISIAVQNLLDERFRFQDSDPSNSPIARERVVFGRVNLVF